MLFLANLINRGYGIDRRWINRGEGFSRLRGLVATGTTVAAFATLTTLAAQTTVAVTAGTVATFAARTALAGLRLHIAFGLGKQGTHGEAVFAGLLVDLDEFDSDLVALFEAGSGHVGETLPGDLGDVEEAVAVGHELNECAEVLDGLHLAGVGLALFGKLYDGVDHIESLVDWALEHMTGIFDSREKAGQPCG